ncbi:glutamyl-tRNA reductase [Methanomethylovorans sp.]|uniref:glutamyl-tRNA reductase n=1 Tax=Methanomethylovorans sp. TaxID=2758717 RepID=UPI00351C01CB
MTEINSMVITHSKASIEEMERSWNGDHEEVLRKLYSNEFVHECVVMKTCNRIEIYVVSPKGSSVLFNFAKSMAFPLQVVEFLDHQESLLHLLRLACGLESMIVGEDQILGQIRDMYLLAKKVGTTGRMLDTAFSKAIQVGKRVRTETEVNRGAVSIGSAAVDLAEMVLGGLEGKMVLVIGTGEMGTLVTRALAHREMDLLYIANRTFEKARDLADSMGGHAVRFENLAEHVRKADVVISATSAPHYVLRRSLIEEIMKGRDRELLLIDIANPRDIESNVAEIEHVKLYNIDNLRIINERSLAQRKEEAKKAEKIVEEELGLLLKQYKQQKADHIVSAIYANVYNVRKQEKERAVTKLRAYHTIGEIENKVLDDLTHSIVNKILAEPTKVLRNAAEINDDELLDVVSRLFNIDRTQETNKDKCK